MGQYTPVSAAAGSTGWAGVGPSELLYSLCISSNEHCYKMSQVLLFWGFGYIVLLLFLVGAVLSMSLSLHLTGACCSDGQKCGLVTKLPGLSTLLLARLNFSPTKVYGVLACLFEWKLGLIKCQEAVGSQSDWQ